MPTAEYTLRSRPWHSGQVVSGSSLKLCTTSRSAPHSVQAYWYVGTGPPSWHSHPTTAKWYAVGPPEPDNGGGNAAQAANRSPASRGRAPHATGPPTTPRRGRESPPPAPDGRAVRRAPRPPVRRRRPRPATAPAPPRGPAPGRSSPPPCRAGGPPGPPP